jgi:hypothetical protein
MERPPAPARAAGTSRQICLILVLGWAAVGAAWWSWAGFGAPLLNVRGWYYSVPSWVSSAAFLGAFALLALWAIMPIALLPAGLDYVRAAGPRNRRRCGAWVGLGAAGIMLEGLPFAVPLAFLSGTPSWTEVAESLGFAAVGAVMIVGRSGARNGAPGQLGPGLRHSTNPTQHPS